MREYHVRICEGLRGKFPGSTRLGLNLGYKVRIQSIVFDFLGGYGGGGGRWTSSTDNRNKIDPFFLGDFSDFTNFIRVEASIGIVFPKVPRK